MTASKEPREWSSTEELPRGFAEWFKDAVKEKETKEYMSFRKIARELSVNPNILSRWVAGMGPLSQNDIRKLASNLGLVVFTFLGIPNPDIEE